MTKFSMLAVQQRAGQTVAKRRGLLYGAAFASALWLAGCSGVELQNRQAADELARLSKPPGSVYTGWRVFQDRCAGYGVDTARDPVSDELLAWARSVSMQASLKATLEGLKSFSTTDFRSDLAAFKVPTLVVHGTEDKTVPIDASSRAAAEGIKHSTLVEYDGAPHGVFATHKRRLTNDLIDFLGR